MKNHKLIRNIAYFIVLSFLLFYIITNHNSNKSNEYNVNKQITYLDIWSIWGEKDILASRILQDLADSYMKQHPEVHITIINATTEVYKTKLPSALAVNEGPDIFFAWGYEFADSLVKSGQVVDLTPYVQELKEEALKNTFDAFTYEDKTYGLPLFGWIMGLYCNVELFEKYNVKIPETYLELVEAVKKFKGYGLTTMALSGREPWAVSFYYMALAQREAGLNQIQNIVIGNESFNNDAMINAAVKLRELKNLGAFADNYYRIQSYEADSLFLQGVIPMYLTGSWLAATIDEQAYSKVTEKIKIIPFPVIRGEYSTDEGIGGYVDTFMINSQSQHKEEAIKAYLDIIPKLGEELTKIGMGLPAWENVSIDENKTIYQFIKIYPDSGYHAAYDQILPPKVSDVHLGNLQDLLEGNITPEEFVDMQAEAMDQYKSNH